MLWTIAYSANYTAAQTDTDMPLLTDPTVAMDSGSHPLLPMPLFDAWLYALGNTLDRVRISAPKFRPIARPLIRPIEQAANPSSRPIFDERFRHPRQYNAVEPIAMLVTNNAPMGGERNFVVATFSDNVHTVPQGDEYTVRCTTSFTPTANAWSASGNVTFDDVLMAGRYSIQGVESYNTGGVAARLIFPGPPLPGMYPTVRPGVIMGTADGQQQTRYFRHGFLGEFGQFESFAPPQLEVIQTGATTNPLLYMDIVQTRMGARY